MTLHTIIEQCLPKERKPFPMTDPHCIALLGLHDEGYNQALSEVKSTIPTIVELLIAGIEKVELKVFDRNIKPAVIQFYKDAVQATKEVIINDLLKQK